MFGLQHGFTLIRFIRFCQATTTYCFVAIIVTLILVAMQEQGAVKAQEDLGRLICKEAAGRDQGTSIYADDQTFRAVYQFYGIDDKTLYILALPHDEFSKIKRPVVKDEYMADGVTQFSPNLRYHIYFNSNEIAEPRYHYVIDSLGFETMQEAEACETAVRGEIERSKKAETRGVAGLDSHGERSKNVKSRGVVASNSSGEVKTSDWVESNGPFYYIRIRNDGSDSVRITRLTTYNCVDVSPCGGTDSNSSAVGLALLAPGATGVIKTLILGASNNPSKQRPSFTYTYSAVSAKCSGSNYAVQCSR